MIGKEFDTTMKKMLDVTMNVAVAGKEATTTNFLSAMCVSLCQGIIAFLTDLNVEVSHVSSIEILNILHSTGNESPSERHRILNAIDTGMISDSDLNDYYNNGNDTALKSQLEKLVRGMSKKTRRVLKQSTIRQRAHTDHDEVIGVKTNDNIMINASETDVMTTLLLTQGEYKGVSVKPGQSWSWDACAPHAGPGNYAKDDRTVIFVALGENSTANTYFESSDRHLSVLSAIKNMNIDLS